MALWCAAVTLQMSKHIKNFVKFIGVEIRLGRIDYYLHALSFIAPTVPISSVMFVKMYFKTANLGFFKVIDKRQLEAIYPFPTEFNSNQS